MDSHINKKISLFSLSILIIAAIDSIRNLPAAAIFGSSLVFFFLFSALIFLIPTALVAAQLSATFPNKGGIYHWIDKALGKRFAMAAIWLQWINTMVWYPSFLVFVAGTFAYLINPELSQNKIYLTTFILIAFWSLTLLNMRGLHVSARINNLCAIMGTIFPMMLLIILGAIWFFQGKPFAIDLSVKSSIPSLNQSTSWVSLIAIMASFLGIELSGVHVNDVEKPQRNFPKAVLLAVGFILFSMIFGSLAIAIVLPEQEISLVAGVMQLFHRVFTLFGLEPLVPFLTLCIGIGSLGTTINWLISPAKGLLHAAESGFLSPFFAKTNRAGVAYRILIGQAILVTLFSLLFLLVPSVNAFYWFLTALSTELYMIMYILMFCAALRLHHRATERVPSFKIPGKGVGIWTTSLLGFFGCTLTILITFLPPTNIDIGSPLRYLLLISVGNLVTLFPLLFFYRYEKTMR